MYNILITGSKGQLGSEIEALHVKYPYDFYFTDKNELDITNFEKVEKFCAKNNITHIVNCAAYTAVDKAEEEKDLANKINHLGVKNLALIASEKNISLVHISTDYVFDGQNYKPYTEDDITNPKGVYGQTKLCGENTLKQINPKNSIIIRTSWVYSSFGNNFVKTMLRLGEEKDELGVVYDQIGSPTYAKDLAKTILNILPKINNEKVEVYHYANEGVVSWFDFAKEIMRMAKIDCKVKPIQTNQYPTPAKRPHYSVLNKAKIKLTFNLEIPYWKDSLDECLKKLNKRK